VVAIEKLDPHHAFPDEARNKMLANLAKRIESLIAVEDFQKALSLVKQGLKIRPNDPDFKEYLAAVQKGLATQSDPKKIAKLVKELNWFMKNKVYVKPKGSCALSTCEKIEEIDKNQPDAKKTRQAIVQTKIDLAEGYLSGKKWDETIASANDGLLVEPMNAKLLDLKTKALEGKEEALAETPEVVIPVAKKCSEGMRYVGGGSVRMGSSPTDPMRRAGEKPNTPTYVAPFCVDLYEYPNQPGQAPKTNITWNEAKNLCTAVGKRLCTEAEWERSCKGPANRRFPYGNDYNANRCATQDGKGQKRSIAAAGGWAGCRSGYGVYDMSGNVREWTASPIATGKSSYVLKGGAADQPDYAVRCAIRVPASANTKSYLVGFRCCKKPNE